MTSAPTVPEAAPGRAEDAVATPEAGAADHVVVRMGSGRYGLAALDVAEVVAVPVLTRLPGAPAWLAGAGNWRGHVLPVVDLRPLLAVDATPLPTSARVVVLSHDSVEVGVLAEAVTGLVEVVDPLDRPPAALDAQATALLLGLADGGPAGPIGVLASEAVVGLRARLPRGRRSA